MYRKYFTILRKIFARSFPIHTKTSNEKKNVNPIPQMFRHKNHCNLYAYRSVELTLPVRSENSLPMSSLDLKSSSNCSPCLAADNMSSYNAVSCVLKTKYRQEIKLTNLELVIVGALFVQQHLGGFYRVRKFCIMNQPHKHIQAAGHLMRQAGEFL